MGRYIELTLPGDPYGPRSVRRDRPYRAYVPAGIAGLAHVPSPATAAALAEAAESAAALDARAEGSRARVSRLVGLLSRSEGIGSSTIEHYSTAVAGIVVADATGARPHNTTTPIVVLDGIAAVEHATSSLGDPGNRVTPDAIESVQRNLLRHSPTTLTGYRTGYVQIGGLAGHPETADFVPPPHWEVLPLMLDLCEFINTPDGVTHPIARAAVAHAQFETIHPFPDGNGRTGRALIQAMLRREGLSRHSLLPISLAIVASPESQRRYVAALNALRTENPGQGDVDLLVTTFSRFVAAAATTASRMIASADAAYERLCVDTDALLRSDSHGRALVDLLASRLGVTVAGAAAALGADPRAVRNTLAKMEGAGLVASRSGGKYGRVFFAPSLISIIEEATGAPDAEDHSAVHFPHLEPPPESRVLVGDGRGRRRSGDRCGHPLRNGGFCMRRAGHGDTGHRATP